MNIKKSDRIDNFIPNEWVSATKTRNYALNDTLVDWLDYWYNGQNIASDINSTQAKSTQPTRAKSTQPIQPKSTQPTLSKSTQTKPTQITQPTFIQPKSTQPTLSSGTFTDFLMNKGTEFETRVIELIKNKIKPNDFVTICADMKNFHHNVVAYEKNTIKAIMTGIPIIYQAVLLNRSGPIKYSYGVSDLLVRSDYLGLIVENNPLTKSQTTYAAPNLSGNYHYVVIDIKFMTLDLCADGKLIRNSACVPANKCQLYIYNYAVGAIQGYMPPVAYILGRQNKYTSKGRHYANNGCFFGLGHIDYQNWDKTYVDKTISAINWIKNLRLNGNKWTICPPSKPELYPNMSSQCSQSWYKIKSSIANNIGEITMLWNCGVKNRQIAHQNGILSYRDPNCTAKILGIKGTKQIPILDEIIKINRKRKFSNKMDNISITNTITDSWITEAKLEFSVDFEAISGIDDDFKSLPDACQDKWLPLIGVTYKTVVGNKTKTKYTAFVATELSKSAEYQLICQFYNFIRDITTKFIGRKHKIPPIHHWGSFEKVTFSKLCAELINEFDTDNDVEKNIKLIQANIEWYDLSECFRNNPIVINGCYNFGLKEISKRLYDLNLIATTWDLSNPCSNGNNAMIISKKAYQIAESTASPIGPLMADVIAYNKVDCVVIHEIMDVMRTKYNESTHNSNQAKRRRTK